MNQPTRRTILNQTALLAASPVLATPLINTLAAEEKHIPGSKMKYGLVTYLWGKDETLPELISLCEKSKTLGIELRTTHKHGVERNLNKQQRADVKKRFKDSPVVHVGIGSNERFDNPDPAVVNKAIEATKAFVKLSHDTGGSGVKVKPDRFYKEVPRKKTIEQIGKALNKTAQFAADYNQEIRLEVHGQCGELPTIAAIMKVADHPNVKVCWNSNNTDLNGEGLVHNFNLVKNRFGKTAHVREFDIGAYPYEQLIELYVKMDYDGWIMLEGRKIPQDKAAGLNHQRQLFEKFVTHAQQKLAKTT